MLAVVMVVGLSQKTSSVLPSSCCPRVLIFTMRFLILLRRKERVWAQPGPELSIPNAMFMQHFVHGLGTESAEYLDMTSGESLFIAWFKKGS
jgi:hypothetical protein